jgi:hypothetical protein
MRHAHARPRHPDVDAWVRSESSPAGPVAKRLVALVRKAEPRHTELVFHGAARFCTAEGVPYCYVAAYSGHANLGFFDGVNLEDPKGLLEGTGKKLRHVKVAEVGEIDEVALVQFVRQAAGGAAGPARARPRGSSRRLRK